MTYVITRLIPAAIALAIATPAFAQDPNIDINGDGMYSYPELTAVLPDLTDAVFEVLDTSGDGLLNADEIANGQAAGLLPR